MVLGDRDRDHDSSAQDVTAILRAQHNLDLRCWVYMLCSFSHSFFSFRVFSGRPPVGVWWTGLAWLSLLFVVFRLMAFSEWSVWGVARGGRLY